MLSSEAQEAVALLYAKFPNPKPATDEGMAEWIKLAMEFRREVWDEAASTHFRTNKYASPNPGEMYQLCQRVRSERLERERTNQIRERSGGQTEAQQRAEAEFHKADTMYEWLPKFSDAELEALRDDFASLGNIARHMVVVAETGDERDKKRNPRLMTAAEIREQPFVACLLRGHEANTKEAV